VPARRVRGGARHSAGPPTAAARHARGLIRGGRIAPPGNGTRSGTAGRANLPNTVEVRVRVARWMSEK